MTKYHIFIKGLNNLLKTLDARYDINWGGCAFVAAVLAREFERAGYKYAIVGGDDLFFKSPDFNEKAHYYLRVSGGFINQSRYKSDLLYSSFNSKEMFDFYYNDSWNDHYEIRHNGCIAGLIRWYFTNNCPRYKK